MSPTLDTLLVAAAVLAALGYLARGFFGKKKSCSSGCGCAVGKKTTIVEKLRE